jgi:hypothetical protein
MPKAKRKKQQPILPVVTVIVLVIIGLWYFNRPAEQPPAPQVEAEPGVEKGDLVAINFVLAMADGIIVDTNNQTLAKEYDIPHYVKGPFRFIVGQSSKLKGFDDAMIGMKLGETRTRVIEPSEPVLVYTIDISKTISRNQPFPLYSPISLGKFEERFSRKPVINDVIVHPDLPWPIKVVNMTEKNVVVESLAEAGRSYTLPGFEWKSLLLVKSKNDMLFRHNPNEGQSMTTEFGPAVVTIGEGRLNITYKVEVGDAVRYATPLEGGPGTIPYDFKVTDVTEKDFTIKRINHPAQEALVLTAELIEWESDVEKKS